MQTDIFPAAKRILIDIESIFKRDANLFSFEIVPIKDNENKSPVFYHENSLALASWCVQPLYCYVYNRLLNFRQYNHREDPELILRYLLGALLLNPDVLTFWNMRREFFRNGRLDPKEELRFVNIVLYNKAKCFEAFSYRRWLLTFMLEKGDLKSNIESILVNEIRIASTAASRYGNNSHAWNHRQHVLLQLRNLSIHKFNSLLDIEWEESKDWCNLHISDYCGFSYRQFLLQMLLSRKIDCKHDNFFLILSKRKEITLNFMEIVKKTCDGNSDLYAYSFKEVLKLLYGSNIEESSEKKCQEVLVILSYWIEECLINEELIKKFSEHQSLWYHRRFLILCYINFNCSLKNFFINDVVNSDLFHITQKSAEKNSNFKTQLKNQSFSHDLLTSTLILRNNNIIDLARRKSRFVSHLAEIFLNFLVSVEFQS